MSGFTSTIIQSPPGLPSISMSGQTNTTIEGPLYSRHLLVVFID